MKLGELIRGVETTGAVADAGGLEVSGLHYDSRRIGPGMTFAAIAGEVTDGNRFVGGAIERGAVAVLSEQAAPASLPAGIGWVRVAQARRALAQASANWFSHPSERLRLVGITGTNGKTTTAFLIEAMLKQAGLRSGLIGTIEYHIGDEVLASPHTTPESYDLQQLLAQMVESGCRAAVAEVSSHALAMDRAWACRFETVVFTNLTQDHLDYHGTMENYREAKRRLFADLGAGAPKNAVVNLDDAAAAAMLSGFSGRRFTFGFSESAGLRIRDLQNTPEGLRFRLKSEEGWEREVRSPMLGRVNALNLAAAVATGLSLGFDPDAAIAAAASLRRVPGRFERVDAGQPFTVVVDYAHTPDALAQVLKLARDIVAADARVLAVFGCGGDRDRGKRPLMGAVAAAQADWTMVTSDNPRSEDPEAIIAEVRQGAGGAAGVRTERDRRAAIAQALSEARSGDIVVIAGKGHEHYQIVGTERLRFDDAEEARAALGKLGWR